MLSLNINKVLLFVLVMITTACAGTGENVTDETSQLVAEDSSKRPLSTEVENSEKANSDVTENNEGKSKLALENEQLAKDFENKKPEVDTLNEKKAEGKARIEQVKRIMQKKKAVQQAYNKKQRGTDINSFYRFKREKAQNHAPINDGVHDPAVDLSDLQSPVNAFKKLPKATFGNGVNWVEALDGTTIQPRADRKGEMKQFTMDMNIQMPVQGTMNDVLFPHKAHTAWLACSNCHTGIFQMKRGGNPITMKKIIDGQYCGVCHGKVAFPIADCLRCHSVPKQTKTAKK